MKKLLTISLILISIGLFSQEPVNQGKDFSLARVGQKIQGVYMFVDVEPYYKYEYVATIKASVEIFVVKSYERTIKKAKKKYPYFNGMIFHDKGKVDLIKFTDEKMTRGGFALEDKVTFMERIDFVKYFFDGIIVELESGKNKASIEYLDKNGNKKIAKIFYGDINPRND